jgi:hypothetical protein
MSAAPFGVFTKASHCLWWQTIRTAVRSWLPQSFSKECWQDQSDPLKSLPRQSVTSSISQNTALKMSETSSDKRHSLSNTSKLLIPFIPMARLLAIFDSPGSTVQCLASSDFAHHLHLLGIETRLTLAQSWSSRSLIPAQRTCNKTLPMCPR